MKGSHATSLGRLCVMASRHKSHLTWVHDGRWSQAIKSDSTLSAKDGSRARAVREALTSGEPDSFAGGDTATATTGLGEKDQARSTGHRCGGGDDD